MKYKALSNSYLSSFCMELVMLLKAGITLDNAILMMQDDEVDKDGKAVLQSLLNTLENGVPLSDALNETGYFPRYMINMAEIGERTGRLTETLESLSEYYDRQDRLSVTIKNAVMYPAMLLIMMVAVVLILIIQVLPIFNDVFARLGTQMSPFATRLMQFGRWLSDVSAVIAVIVGVIVVVALISWAIPSVREGITIFFRNMFGARGIFGKIASSRFTSSMTLAMTSGLALTEAAALASSVSGGSKAVDERNKVCLDMLNSGSTISEAVRGAGIVSPRDGRMLAVGRRSGREAAAIAEIARRNDLEVQDEIGRLVGKIEPTLVIITSVIVGIILLSVMLPLIGIMTAIG